MTLACNLRLQHVSLKQREQTTPHQQQLLHPVPLVNGVFGRMRAAAMSLTSHSSSQDRCQRGHSFLGRVLPDPVIATSPNASCDAVTASLRRRQQHSGSRGVHSTVDWHHSLPKSLPTLSITLTAHADHLQFPGRRAGSSSLDV